MSNETPKKLTPEELSEIDARAKAATPGPWEFDPTENGSDGLGNGFFALLCGNSEDMTLRPLNIRVLHYLGRICGHNENASSDANFVSYARTDIPRLLAHAAALEAEIARLRGTLIEAAEDLERKAEWANTPSCCPTLEALAEGITIQAADLRAEVTP